MRYTKAIVTSVVAMATIGSAYVTAAYCNSYRTNKTIEEALTDLDKSKEAVVDKYKPLNTSKYSVKMEDGYVSYVITYSDTEGNRLNIKSEPFLISNNGEVYQDIEQAKKAKVIKDYIQDDVYYFQLKNGADIAWYANPSDTSSVSNWSEDKANIALAAHATAEYNSRVIRQNIIIDYTDEVDVTFEEQIK